MVEGLNVFYFGWEESLDLWFQTVHNTACDVIMNFFSFCFDKGWMAFVAMILFLIFAKDKRIGWQTFVSLFITVLICNVILKNIVMRARPCDVFPDIPLIAKRPDDSSFPSGHTNAAFTLATVIFTRNKKWGIPALIVAAIVGISRMYLFMHWPTDVLVSAILGVIGGTIGYFIVNWFFKKTGKPVDTLKIF